MKQAAQLRQLKHIKISADRIILQPCSVRAGKSITAAALGLCSFHGGYSCLEEEEEEGSGGPDPAIPSVCAQPAQLLPVAGDQPSQPQLEAGGCAVLAGRGFHPLQQPRVPRARGAHHAGPSPGPSGMGTAASPVQLSKENRGGFAEGPLAPSFRGSPVSSWSASDP